MFVSISLMINLCLYCFWNWPLVILHILLRSFHFQNNNKIMTLRKYLRVGFKLMKPFLWLFCWSFTLKGRISALHGTKCQLLTTCFFSLSLLFYSLLNVIPTWVTFRPAGVVLGFWHLTVFFYSPNKIWVEKKLGIEDQDDLI